MMFIKTFASLALFVFAAILALYIFLLVIEFIEKHLSVILTGMVAVSFGAIFAIGFLYLALSCILKLMG